MWFNTTEVETNMFVMADEVYNMMEIFNEAASFEARMIKHIDTLLAICDVLVFVMVAFIVGRYLAQNCFQKLQRTVERGTSNLPRLMAQMKKIKEKRSIRGSNASFREVEDEKINSDWRTKYIQNKFVQGFPRSPIMSTNFRNDTSKTEMIPRVPLHRGIDDDEVTLMPEPENYSALLMGTPEWAANYLATGGSRQGMLLTRGSVT